MIKEIEIKLKKEKCSYNKCLSKNMIENQEECKTFRREARKQLREEKTNDEKVLHLT